MEEHKENEVKEANQNRNIERQSITLVIIMMLALASFVGAYFIFKPKPYFEYRNLKVYPFKLENTNMLFYSIPLDFEVNGQAFQKNIVIRNNPYDIENISYEMNESLFIMGGIGFTMNATLSTRALIAAQEISKLSQTLQIPTFFGVTEQFEDREVDVFDCINATSIKRVARLELGNETKITSENNCIIITGEDYDHLMMASDKLAVEWLKKIVKNEAS